MTEDLVPARTALVDPDGCKRHFSAARWAAFTEDIAWFRNDSPTGEYWQRMQGDHVTKPA